MLELTQTLWAVALVAFPVGLFLGAGLMVWRAGGLPAPENMAVLESVTEVVSEHSARLQTLEKRQDASDDHLRALGRDVAPMGRVVSIRGRG